MYDPPRLGLRGRRLHLLRLAADRPMTRYIVARVAAAVAVALALGLLRWFTR